MREPRKTLRSDLDLDSLGQWAWFIANESGWHRTLRCRAPGAAIDAYGVERVMTNLALVHSEVSEAVEAVRKDPAHVGEELADVIIRVVELAHMLGISLNTEVQAKMMRNRERLDVPARAGGKAV